MPLPPLPHVEAADWYVEGQGWFMNVRSSDNRVLALRVGSPEALETFCQHWPRATLATMTRDEIVAVVHSFHAQREMVEGAT